MSQAQALVAAYRLTQAVVLTPARTSRLQIPVTIGLKEEYDCVTCSDSQKAERGFCPYAKEQRPGEVPQLIDSTGNDSFDLIHACPRGLVITNPALTATIETFHKSENMGGAAAYFGAPLCVKPKRLTDTYSLLVAAESRMKETVLKSRRQMDGG